VVVVKYALQVRERRISFTVIKRFGQRNPSNRIGKEFWKIAGQNQATSELQKPSQQDKWKKVQGFG